MTLAKTDWTAGNAGHIAEHNLIGTKLNRELSVYDYGAVGDGTTDDTTAIQNTINAVSSAGGGIVHLPKGSYKVTAELNWASKVSLIGEGMGASILKFYTNGEIHYSGSPLTDCLFQDFQIDGTNQTDQKGFFMTPCIRVNFLRVYVHHTAFTGFGNDHMVDCVYDSCVAEDCGRLGTVETPGCAGFGIGTGQHQVEPVMLINCIARNNKRYGVFFEQQDIVSPYYSRGAQIIGGYFEGNNWGIGDCGVDGLIISGAHVNDNDAEGIYVGGPSILDLAGTNGIITGCEIARNGAPGIEPAAPSTYVLSGNNLHDNGT